MHAFSSVRENGSARQFDNRQRDKTEFERLSYVRLLILSVLHILEIKHIDISSSTIKSPKRRRREAGIWQPIKWWTHHFGNASSLIIRTFALLYSPAFIILLHFIFNSSVLSLPITMSLVIWHLLNPQFLSPRLRWAPDSNTINGPLPSSILNL